MIDIRRAPLGLFDLPPLTWRPLQDGARRSASMACSAGHHATLTDHAIGDDGAVAPSVVCPVEGCSFHEHVRLIGWRD